MPTPTDGFELYDDLNGPDLTLRAGARHACRSRRATCTSRWTPTRELAVGEGEVRVTIPRFSLAHDRFQAVDSAKHLTVSTRRVRAAARRARDVRRRPGGREHRRRPGGLPPRDGRLPRLRPRRDPARVRRRRHLDPRVRDARAAGPGRRTAAFYHVIESPYADFDDDFTRLRTCEITLDRSRSTAALERRRPEGLRGPRHRGPRRGSDRVRDLDDAADPRRSQPLA